MWIKNTSWTLISSHCVRHSSYKPLPLFMTLFYFSLKEVELSLFIVVTLTEALPTLQPQHSSPLVEKSAHQPGDCPRLQHSDATPLSCPTSASSALCVTVRTRLLGHEFVLIYCNCSTCLLFLNP